MEPLVFLIIVALVVCLIVLPICSFVRLGHIGDEIRALRRAIDALEGDRSRATEKREMPVIVAEDAPIHAPTVARPLPPLPDEFSSPAPEIAIAPEAAAPEPTAVEILLGRCADYLAVRGEFAPAGMTREFAFVTRWLVRIGIALLVGCVIYFMKLSVDRGWVGPAARTLSVIAFGAAFAVLGAVLVRRGRYAPVGHALAGLGFIGLYLGFGLGHRFFDPPVIASPAFAFAALAAVTAIAGVYAVRLPSAHVAVLGLVGGYLVPVIAGRDSGHPLGLDVYVFALVVAAAYVAHRRRWSALDFLATALAFAMCLVWHSRHPGASAAIHYVSLGFLSAIHVLYLAATVAGTKARERIGNALAWTGLATNAAAYLAWTLVVLRPVASDAVTGVVLLVTVSVYAVLARVAMRRGWADRVTVQMMLIFAFAYLAFAPIPLVSRPYLVTAWCLIAAAAGESGRRIREPILGYLALVLLMFASVAGLASALDGRPFVACALGFGSYLAELLTRLIRFACVPVAFALFAWRGWLPTRRGARAWLLAVASLFAFLYLTAESRLFGDTYWPGLKGGTVTITWGLVALGSLAGGVIKGVKPVRLAALALLALTVAKLLLFDTARLAVSYRVLTLGATGIALLVGAVFYLKFKERFERHDS